MQVKWAAGKYHCDGRWARRPAGEETCVLEAKRERGTHFEQESDGISAISASSSCMGAG